MLTLGDLLEERWEVRRFHLWYMEAAKLGLHNFVINIPAEYFQMPTDGVVVVDFHDMHRLLRRKDLDVSQVTIFAL
jgi:pantothenate kinase